MSESYIDRTHVLHTRYLGYKKVDGIGLVKVYQKSEWYKNINIAKWSEAGTDEVRNCYSYNCDNFFIKKSNLMYCNSCIKKRINNTIQIEKWEKRVVEVIKEIKEKIVGSKVRKGRNQPYMLLTCNYNPHINEYGKLFNKIAISHNIKVKYIIRMSTGKYRVSFKDISPMIKEFDWGVK